ncbi:MAG: hypothetical protein DRJ49_05350 [Thermoprotei archaeon]|nr:MAG: hypothetical protein DRJ49_05350 [Thermoprotei archaeon]
MLIYNDYLEYIIKLALVFIIICILHRLIPKFIRSMLIFRHPLIYIISKGFKSSRKRALSTLSLLLKLFIAFLVISAHTSPTIERTELIRKVVEKDVVLRMDKVFGVPVIVLLDVSGSMAKDEKLRIAKEAIRKFIDELPLGFDIGLIAFNEALVVVQPITSERNKLYRVVEELEAGGGTAFYPPLKAALDLLKPYAKLKLKAFVVLATDGIPSDRMEYRRILTEYRQLNIPIHTVFVGRDPIGREETVYIANSTGGRQYTAFDVEKLPEVMLQVAEEVKHEVVTRVTIEVEEEVKYEEPIYEPLLSIALLALIVLWLLNKAIYKTVF